MILRSYAGRILLPLSLVFVALLTSCGGAAPVPASGPPSTAASASAKALTPFKYLFTFQLQAGAGTAAVVIAKDQGYFAQQGIDFSWDVVNSASTGLKLIATGQYQAGSGGPGQLIDMVSQQLPVQAVAIVNQVGSRTFAVRADSTIKTPKDFEGKKVGIKVAPWAEYLCMLKANKVDQSKIQEVSVGTSSVELKTGMVDVLPIFKSNEPLALKGMGVDIRMLDPESFGCANTWGNTLLVNKQYAADHPDVVRGWLKATMQALYFYKDNKQKALDIFQKYSAENVTPATNEFLYSVDATQISNDTTSKNGLGWMTKTQWDQAAQDAVDQGLVKTKLNPDDLMTTRFLEQIYKDGKLLP